MAAAASSSSTGGSSKYREEGSVTAMVADQISQTVQSTSNLLHLMLQSSPSQAVLMKLPRNLLAKTSTIKNTEQALEQLPWVTSVGRCVYGRWSRKRASSQNCYPVTCKYGKLPAGLSLCLELTPLQRNLNLLKYNQGKANNSNF